MLRLSWSSVPPAVAIKDAHSPRRLTRRTATPTASFGANMNDLIHVAVGWGGCFLRTAAVLTGAQVGCVPVPPVVRGVRILELAVVLAGLVEELGKGSNVRA